MDSIFIYILRHRTPNTYYNAPKSERKIHVGNGFGAVNKNMLLTRKCYANRNTIAGQYTIHFECNDEKMWFSDISSYTYYLE